MDQEVIKILDEESLEKYIPHFGDQMFAKNWTDSSNAEAARNAEKKKTLINRLRAKMKLPVGEATTSTAHSAGSGGPGYGNRNAFKKTRKIELGWMHYNDGSFKQVRRPTGGGTRDIIVKKNDTVDKILTNGKNIFFPNGKSSKGHIKDFDFCVCLIGSDESLDAKITVEELYDSTHHKVLRLYICSKKKTSDSDPSDLSDHDKLEENSETTEVPMLPSLSHTITYPSPSTDVPLCSSSPVILTTFSTTSPQPSGSEQMMSVSHDDDEIVFLSENVNTYVDGFCDTLIYSPVHNNENSSDVTDDAFNSNLVTSTQIIDTNCNSESDTCTHSESEPVLIQEAFFENPENIVEKTIIIIRKTHCISDMVEAFAEENILHANVGFRRILENGELENGVGSGIAMDCVTDFWNMFYETKTSGTTYKIPDLHHSFQEREWKAVAQILAFGWQRFKYLPMQLAPPFLKEALSLTTENCSLMESFFHYISPTEKDVLTEALNDFKGADLEELLSILSSHYCTVLPNEKNI